MLLQYNQDKVDQQMVTDELAVKNNYQSFCLKEHPLELRQPGSKRRECKLCESEIKKNVGKFYACDFDDDCQFAVCVECTVKNYMR